MIELEFPVTNCCNVQLSYRKRMTTGVIMEVTLHYCSKCNADQPSYRYVVVEAREKE